MLIKLTNENIPYFNAGIFLENKTKIGKVDEILGPINQVSPPFEQTGRGCGVYSSYHTSFRPLLAELP